jgi:ADP-ribose pyrophosphatase
MKKTDIRVLDRETLFQGWMRLERWRIQHPLFQGGESRAFTREVMLRNNAVGVLPYDPVRDRVCLIQQFRAGSFAGGADPISTEIVAGLMDKDEDGEGVARREAMEEAGITIKRLTRMGGGFTMPGSSNEYFTFFCGEADLPDTASKIFGLVEEDENIRTLILPREEAIRKLDDGSVTNNLPTLYALTWLARFGEKLRKDWG